MRSQYRFLAAAALTALVGAVPVSASLATPTGWISPQS